MTGLKIAASVISLLGGVASVTTGTIVANVPAISNDTPVSLTLGLVFVGVGATATAAWKVSRAWSQLENKITALEEQVSSLRKTRSANIAAKLRAYEAALEAEERERKD